MVFVNEIVSEEEVKIENLDALHKKYNPMGWRKGRPVGFSHSWTIDRDLGSYFIVLCSIREIGQTGNPQPTGKKLCVLKWRGTLIRIVIELDPGSSSEFKETPFMNIWNLLEIDAPDASRSEVVSILKEALKVYGYRGAFRQIRNTVVEFNF
ncbi:hypothetical protein [Endothiovibrio diazotrophicus]